MVALFSVVNRWGNHMVDGEEVLGIRFVLLYSATTEQSVGAQKTENRKMNKERTQYVNVETQMCEKPRQPTTAENHYERNEYNKGEAQRQRPLSPLLCHTAVTMEATTSLSLSLSHSHSVSIHSYALYTYNYKSVQQHKLFSPKSYLIHI